MKQNNGEIRMMCDRLSVPLYACMVAKLSNLQNNWVYEYLKLVLDAVYQMNKVNKKGHEIACKIERFIKEKDNPKPINKKL